MKATTSSACTRPTATASPRPASTRENEVGEINANIDTLVTEQFPALARAVPGRRRGQRVHRARRRRADRSTSPRRAPARWRRPIPLTRDFERSIAGLTAVNPYTGNDRPADGAHGRPDRHEGAAHVHHRRSGAQRHLRAVRRPELLPHRLSGVHLQDLHQSGVRLEPRRHPARDRHDLAGHRRARRAPAETHRYAWTDHTDVRPTMLALLGLATPTCTMAARSSSRWKPLPCRRRRATTHRR